MTTTLPTAEFFRLKAAQHDLIVRAGGIERAASICGYGKSHVARWGSREHPDMMPVSAVIALMIAAYVRVAAASADVSAEMSEALADGVITGSEQQRIDAKAAALDDAVEGLRNSLAGTGGKVVKMGDR